MADSVPKQLFIGIVVTVIGGLVLWWLTTGLDRRALSTPQTAQPPSPSDPQGQSGWLGFANEISAGDRDAELRARCGEFKRVYVPPIAGNKFTDLCKYECKSCGKVCDWEGRSHPCDAISQGGRRDGTRLAFCR